MDITHLHIENCLTIGRADLELDGRGLMLIQGQNLDDSSAASNGAGKSSIVDALCWAIYGTTARDVSGDDVVNETAKKDCVVMVTLDDNGTRYKIERFRKHAKFKNQLMVWQLDPLGGPSVPLHKGTEKETQLVILKIMGCSLEVFVGSIYAGQEKMPDLPGMTDKFLKLLVEEAAGVEELAEAHKIASKDALTADKALAAAQAAHTTAAAQEQHARDHHQEAVEQKKLFEDTRRDRARAELAKVPPLQKHIEALTASVALYDVPTLQARKTTLDAQLAAVAGEQTKLQQLEHEARTAGVYEAVTMRDLKAGKAHLDAAKAELTDLSSKVGTPCKACGKPTEEHDLDELKRHKEAQVAGYERDLRDQAVRAKAAKVAADAARTAVETHRACMTDVSGASAELSKINSTLHDAQKQTWQINQYGEEIKAIKKAAGERMTEPNPWAEHEQRRDNAWKAAELKTHGAYLEVQKAEAAAELAADAVRVFGPAGVRAHILDSVTPFLNDRTREYLGTLADGNIHATWNTLDTNAKGELREKFNIAVTNDKGGKSFKAQSGGEKRKVRLACALALQDMVASRATKPINLFLADEIDDALDDPGLERLMSVLDTKAKERGTVLVISHNPLADWIDSVITVTKSGGQSTVDGAAVRGF